MGNDRLFQSIVIAAGMLSVAACVTLILIR
jgi:hypothetical protein